MTRYRELLFSYFKPQWPRVLLMAALLLSGIGLELINPQVLRYFIDTARAGDTSQTLAAAALIFLGFVLASMLLSVFATYISEDVGWRATNMLRAALASHCLRLDLSFHTAHSPGELIERIDGDVSMLANFFSQFVIRILGNTILVVGVLILLFAEDWRIGLTFTGFTIVALAILQRTRDFGVSHWTAARQASADFFGFLEERLVGAEDIRTSAATGYVLVRFYRLVRERLQKDRQAALRGSVMWSTTAALFTVSYGLAFGLGAYLFSSQSITISTVYLIFYYIGILNRPLDQITAQMADLQRASAGISRIDELLQTQSAIQDEAGASLPPGLLSVEFERVSFGYRDRDPVLHDVSFDLAPGEVLGLLGRTGSGKTTIARLLFRLYDPTAGAVRLGGVDIRSGRVADVRARVGMVTQDVQIFHATVRDNLTCFDQGISDEQILCALDDLELQAWRRSLPDGLDTQLTAHSALSAGEAQLAAFTRIFLKDPDLVILDEASSRLDPVTDHLIERAVDKLLSGRTGIIIAHRLKTVRRADTIMILEDGRICEYGRREILERDPASRFYRLLHSGTEDLL